MMQALLISWRSSPHCHLIFILHIFLSWPHIISCKQIRKYTMECVVGWAASWYQHVRGVPFNTYHSQKLETIFIYSIDSPWLLRIQDTDLQGGSLKSNPAHFLDCKIGPAVMVMKRDFTVLIFDLFQRLSRLNRMFWVFPQ